MPKALRRSLVVLAVILGLVYGGGGWYFSGVLEDDLLQPTAPEEFYDSEVVGIVDGAVTILQGPKTGDGLTTAGVSGLDWGSGFGQLRDIRNVDGDQVTRDFDHMTGDPVTVGDLVAIVGAAFPLDPQIALGRPTSDVSYQTPIGEMGAWLVSGAGDTWVIVVHGKSAPLYEATRFISEIAEFDLPTLVMAYRNDVGQPADPTGYYLYGQSEWEDLAGAMDFARSNGAAEVVLVGFSTGAGIIMEYLDQAGSDDVIAVVLDSPNVDVSTTVDTVAARRTVPGTGIPIPQSLTSVAKGIAGLRFDIDWDEIDYVDGPNVLTMPVLILAGSEDMTVPVSISNRLVEKYPHATLVVFEGADHMASWNSDPDRYDEVVSGFLAAVTR